MHGYCGKILRVDLGTGSVREEPLRPEDAKTYIGGSGLAAHLFFEAVAPAAEEGKPPSVPACGPGSSSGFGGYPDPLAPENPLIIMTGPLTGTRLPAANRWTVSARSPLTGIWGEANVGGSFGAELKFAGYDGIFITGRASQPVYLAIDADGAKLAPAAGIWGKDTYETDDLLATDGAKVLCIGPAGENLVRYACAGHGKHHYAGRAGMGAVMGSKNLKAVVVRGKGKAPEAADPEGLKQFIKEIRARFAESIVITTLTETGTLSGLDLGNLTGDIPLRNWSQGAWDQLENVGVGNYNEHLTGSSTCYACPCGCFREVSIEARGRTLKDAPGAEYETTVMLGPNLLISDFPTIHAANDVCNRLGLDTISAGATVAYAYEAADRGLLGSFAGGGELKGAWGDGARLLPLLEDIAHRRGFGRELGDGSRALATKIGSAEALEFLTAVKGLELPGHDPRAAHGMGIAYATSNRGGCHMNSVMYGLEHTGYDASVIGVDYDGSQQVSAGKGVFNKTIEDLSGVFGQSAILCHLGGSQYRPDDLLKALNLVTGWGLTMEAMLEAGARIWHLKRGIGNLYGVTAADDRLPPRFLQALEDGGAAGSVPDMDLMTSEWIEARGIDPETGRAKPEVLEGLGLERLAKLLKA